MSEPVKSGSLSWTAKEQCDYINFFIECHYRTAIELTAHRQLGYPVSRYMYTVEYIGDIIRWEQTVIYVKCR